MPRSLRVPVLDGQALIQAQARTVLSEPDVFLIAISCAHKHEFAVESPPLRATNLISSSCVGSALRVCIGIVLVLLGGGLQRLRWIIHFQ